MTLATLVDGKTDLSDRLLLIAAVLFVIPAVLRLTSRPDPTRGALIPLGLAFFAVAALVL